MSGEKKQVAGKKYRFWSQLCKLKTEQYKKYALVSDAYVYNESIKIWNKYITSRELPPERGRSIHTGKGKKGTSPSIFII